MNNPALSKYISLSLKVVGLVFLLSSLVDYLALAIPFRFEPTWQYNLVSNIIDRGVVPLIGIILFLVGYWIAANQGDTQTPPLKRKFEFRLPVLVLSSLLGLIFLILIPLHIYNIVAIVNANNSQIAKQAEDAQQKIQKQYDQLYALSQNPNAIKQLGSTLKNIDQALAAGEFNGQRLNEQQKQELLQRKQQFQDYEQLAKDPNALEARLNQLQNELKQRTSQAKNTRNRSIYKQGLRIILNAIFLTIGYTIVGWAGLATTQNLKLKGLVRVFAKNRVNAKSQPKKGARGATGKKPVRPQRKPTPAKKGVRPQNKGGWFNKQNGNTPSVKPQENQPPQPLNIIEPDELEIENKSTQDRDPDQT